MPHPNAARRPAAVLTVMALLLSVTVLVNGDTAAATEARPQVTLDTPAKALLGSTATFTATFDNTTGTAIGYGPHIDLVIAVNGADGAAGTDTPDGLSFVSATYLGAPVTATVRTFTDDGTGTGTGVVNHPFSGPVTGTIGDQLVTIELPFGSFTSTQPPADVEITVAVSDLADLGHPLPVDARALFRYGTTPTGTTPVASDWTRAEIEPAVVTFDHTVTPDSFAVTGPNFGYTVTARTVVAPGHTVDNVEIVNTLPLGVVFDGVTTPPGGTVTAAPPVGGTVTAAERDLRITVDALSGTTTTTIALTVPYRGDDTNPIIAPGSQTGSFTNTVAVTGDWTPVDPRDPAPAGNVDVTGIATQTVRVTDTRLTRSPSGALTPGQAITFTATSAVSDHYAIDGTTKTLTIGDGWRVTFTTPPTVTVTAHGTTVTGALAPGEWTSTVDVGGTGDQTITADIDTLLARLGAPEVVRGGCFAPTPTGGSDPDCGVTNGGATTVTVTVAGTVQHTYDGPTPSGDPDTIQGDHLAASATLDSTTVDHATFNPGTGVHSTGGASGALPAPTIAHTVHAINGTPVTGAGPHLTSPGDRVTYRIQVTNPIGRFRDQTITAFAPLPVVDVTELTTFDVAAAGTIPPAGVATYGPNNTTGVVGVTPALSTNGDDNTVTFTVGTATAEPPSAVVVDVMYTVTADDARFADGLILTSLARVTSTNTELEALVDLALTQIRRTEPVVGTVTKGVVAVTGNTATIGGPAGPVSATPVGSPGFRFTGPLTAAGIAAHPVHQPATGFEAGDTATMAVVVANTGSGAAFDVTIVDQLNPNFAPAPGGLNLTVTDGAGNPRPWTPLGATYFDGIRVDGVPGDGAIGPAGTDGSDLLVVTYDVIATTSVEPTRTYDADVDLTGYAGSPDGPNYLTAPLSATARVTTGTTTTATTIAATSEAHTGFAGGAERVTVGEIVRYRVTARVPQGTISDANIVAQLPNALRYLDDGTASVALVADTTLSSDTLSGPGLFVTGGTATVAGITPTTAIAATGGPFANGTNPTFALGTLVNADVDTDDEYVIVEFNTVVVNPTGQNTAVTVTGQFRTGTQTLASNQVTARTTSPTVNLAKTVVAGVTEANTATTFRLTVSAPTTANGGPTSTAFDLTLTDELPANLTLLTVGTPTTTGTVTGVAADHDLGANRLRFTIAGVEPGATFSVDYTARLEVGAANSTAVTNTGTVIFTSLPGPNGTTTNPTGSATPGAAGTATGELAVTATSSADIVVANPVPALSVIATSLADTAGTSVTIGEIVRYRATARVPQGTHPNLGLFVDLPNGLTYLNDATTRAALVSHGGLAASAVSAPAAHLTGSTVVTPTWTLPAANLSPNTTFSTGQDPLFNFGTVVNADADTDAEWIVVDFNAVVSNTSHNNTGGTRNTRLFVRNGTTNLASTGNVGVTAVATAASSTLTAAPGTVEAGVPVTVTGTFTNNASTAPLYDLTWVLTVDPDFAPLTAGSVAAPTTSGGLSPGDVTVTLTGPRQVTVTVARLTPGQGFTLGVEAVPTIAVTPGQVLGNTSVARWTTLPGVGSSSALAGSTPGAAGSSTGERTGTGTGVNNLTVTRTANVTVDNATFTLARSTEFGHSGAGGAVPGETVTFTATIILPEGTTPGFAFTAPIPNGFTLVPGSVTVDTTGFGGTLGAVTNASGADTVSVAFDTTVVDVDGDPTNNRFTVTYAATVNDAPINTPGRVVAHTATAFGTNRTVEVTTRRVDLRVTHTGHSPTANPGGPLTWPIVVTNAGDVVATGVTVAFVVPADTTIDLVASTPGISCAGVSCSYAFPDAVNAGQTGEIHVVATVDNPLAAGITATSLTSAVSDDGASGSDFVPADNLATSTVNLPTAPDLNVTITPTAGTAAAGAGHTWTVTWANTGNQDATEATVSVTVGAHLGVNAAASDPAWTCGTGTPTVCTIAVGDLTGGGAGTGTADLTVGVDPVLPAGALTATAVAAASDDGANGADPTPADNTATATVDLDADVDVAVTIGSPGSVTAGTTADLTVGVTNTGTRGAAGTVVTVTLPAGTAAGAGAGAAGWTCTADTCARNFGVVEVGDTPTAALPVQVVSPAAAAVSQLTFAATVTDDGVNGPDVDLTNNDAETTSSLVAVPDLTVAIDGPAAVAAGTTPVWNVTVTNTGNQDATGVTVTVTVGDHTNATTDTAAAGWTCAAGVCSRTVGDLTGAGGTTGPIGLPLAVDSTLPAGVDGTTHVATTTDDATNGADPTPADNTAQVATPVTAEPDLAVVVNAPPTVTAGTQGLWTFDVSNTGTQGATGVTITVTIPDWTAANADTVTVGWTCVAGACTRAVGGLDVGHTAGFALPLSVAGAVDAGVETITATATVTDDGTNGADPTPADNTATGQSTLVAHPDLVVAVTAPPGPVTAGADTTFTVTVTNTGTQGATGVTVTVPVPAGATPAPTAAAGWVCGAGVCTLTVGLLPVGDTATIDLDLVVEAVVPAGVDHLTVTATAGDDGLNGPDPTPVDNTADGSVDLDATPDLVVDISGPATVTAGGTATWTVEVTNAGTQDATGVTVTVTLPAELTGADGSWTCLGAVCTTVVGALAGGGVTTTVALATSVTGAAAAGVETVTVEASAADDGTNGADPTPANNTATTVATFDAVPDLELGIDADVTTVTPGGTVSFTVRHRNTGTQGAAGVTVTVAVPAGTTFEPGTSSTWSCTNGVCDHAVGDIEVGASGQLTFTVTVDEPFTVHGDAVTLVADITDDGTNGADPTPANNTDTAVVSVVPLADVEVAVTDDPAPALAGETVTFDLTVTNNGPNAAQSVAVTVTGLDHLDGVTVTGPWTCGPVIAGDLTCQHTASELVTGGTVGLTVAGTVAGDAAPVSVVVASVSSATADPDGTNNADTTTTVAASPAADLGIAVTVTPTTWRVGQQATVDVAVTNTGPSTSEATSDDPISVTVALPAGTTVAQWPTVPGWVCDTPDPTVVTCELPAPVAANSGAPVLGFVVDVADAATGTRTVTGTVTAGLTVDPVAANNVDDPTVTVLAQANLAITKSADGDFVVDDTATFTLTVTNAGPSAAASPIVVVDTLPAGLSYLDVESDDAWTCAVTDTDPDGVETVTCQLVVTFAMGRTSSLTLVVAVTAATADVVDNTATVTSGTEDPDPGDNTTSSGTTPVTPTIDLDAHVVNSGPFTIDTDGQWTVRAVNNGPSHATAPTVVHIDTPAGATIAASGAGWACEATAGGFTCTTGPLASGETSTGVVVTVPVTAADHPRVELAATVEPHQGANDPDTANNTATSPAEVTPVADLVVHGEVTGVFVRGGTGVFRWALTNDGPTPHPGPVTVTFTHTATTVPTAVTAPAGWACTVDAQAVTCTTANQQPVGPLGVFDITADVVADGEARTVAVVDGGPWDAHLPNSTAVAATGVTPVVVWKVSKAPDGPVVAGAQVTWTITVTNEGPSTTTTATTVVDTLPDGLVFVSGTGDGFSCDAGGNLVTCAHTDPIGAGETRTLAVVTEVTAGADAGVVNVVTVAGSGAAQATASAAATVDAAPVVPPDTPTPGPGVPTPPAPQGTPPGAPLPRTGAESTTVGLLGVLLVAAGAATVEMSRRLRRLGP
jgi:uncharacterized repeat protein (TIGR01451 family)